MKDESTVQQEIQIGLMPKCTIMRNNNGACMNDEGRLIRYGLGHISKQQNESTKSSDLIGITPVLITKEMVGKTLGVFTAVEAKNEKWNINKKLDKREIAQDNFINWVKHLGGFAGFASSLDEAKEIINY